MTHFAFHISQDQYVTLKIYDMHGKEIAVLAEEKMQAGEQALRFDASGLPAGLYFYRLAVNGQRSAVSGKLVKY
jgi:hypothetical protein